MFFLNRFFSQYYLIAGAVLFFVFLGQTDGFGSVNDPARINKLIQEDWKQIVTTEKDWPGILFPLSQWKTSDKEKLPSEYYVRYNQGEKKWPKFIKDLDRRFENQYGRGIRNLYELYRQERKPADPSNADPSAIQKKTADRLVDLICLPAERLNPLKGVPIQRLRVLVYKQGRLQVIPYDILEFTSQNRVVLPFGPESNPHDANNRFDCHDKLFFMAVDSGDRIRKEVIRHSIGGVEAVAEVELFSPEDNETAWVYVVSFSGEPSVGTELVYGNYDENANIIYSQFLMGQQDFRPIRNGIHPTLGVQSWLVSPSAGGIPIDIYDSIFFQYRIKLFPWITVDESIDNVDISWRAWYTGAVISFHRSTWQIKTPLGIAAPTVFADTLSCPFFTNTTITISNPIDPEPLVKSVEISLGDRLLPGVYRYEPSLKLRYLNSLHRKGFAVDGKMDPAETIREDQAAAWHLITGKPGTVLFRTIYDRYTAGRQHRSIWLDDKQKQPQYCNIVSMDGLTARNFQFSLEWSVVPFFWDADPDRYNWKNLSLALKHVDKPLQYRIDGHAAIKACRFVHMPDVQTVKNYYQY